MPLYLIIIQHINNFNSCNKKEHHPPVMFIKLVSFPYPVQNLHSLDVILLISSTERRSFGINGHAVRTIVRYLHRHKNQCVYKVNRSVVGFYKATMPSESGLADLINLACANIKYSGYPAKLLEKIILADYSNINEFYTQTFLLLVADTLMGEYSFTTLKKYDIAQRLYEKVKCGFPKSTSEALNELATSRLICCDFLSMTKLNPASQKTFTAMAEASASDGFACTLLAFYYLTAHYNSVSQNNHDFILDEAIEDYPNDTAEENKETFDSYHKLGMQYLNKALSNEYRPAFYLFKYLGDNGLLTKYKSKETEKFIRETPLRIIDPLLAV